MGKLLEVYDGLRSIDSTLVEKFNPRLINYTPRLIKLRDLLDGAVRINPKVLINASYDNLSFAVVNLSQAIHLFLDREEKLEKFRRKLSGVSRKYLVDNNL